MTAPGLTNEQIITMLQLRVANIDRHLERNTSVAYRDEMTRAHARGKREAYVDALIMLGADEDGAERRQGGRDGAPGV
jgi:hypothetical protein